MSYPTGSYRTCHYEENLCWSVSICREHCIHTISYGFSSFIISQKITLFWKKNYFCAPTTDKTTISYHHPLSTVQPVLITVSHSSMLKYALPFEKLDDPVQKTISLQENWSTML
ncbi:hypothetical protein X798_03274 [Onchocerca flexuosa]|uniref:Uncharacterized protein n=1 Tax=Onchocerca flexuosa TaxID=387005 RepID=A0A238BW83_9BILA|nr:hypothetical protein X798_03274 [Onchocerca flexuosa]